MLNFDNKATILALELTSGLAHNEVIKLGYTEPNYYNDDASQVVIRRYNGHFEVELDGTGVELATDAIDAIERASEHLNAKGRTRLGLAANAA